MEPGPDQQPDRGRRSVDRRGGGGRLSTGSGGGTRAEGSAVGAVIRQFQTSDGASLRHLWEAVGFRALGDDDESLARFALRNPGMFFVAEADGLVVGSTMAAWDGRRGWLYHVAVAAPYRRSGLATRLVTLAEAALRAIGSPRALVIVEVGNDPAFAFWHALGYETRDTRHLGKGL